MKGARLVLAVVLLASQAALLAAVVLAPRASTAWRGYFIERRIICWPGGSGAAITAAPHCLRPTAT